MDFPTIIKKPKVSISPEILNELSTSDINATSTYNPTTHNFDASSTRILGTNDFLMSTYTYDSCNRLSTSSSNTHLDLTNNQSLLLSTPIIKCQTY